MSFKKWMFFVCIIVLCVGAYNLYQKRPRTQIIGVVVTDTHIPQQRIYASYIIEGEDTEWPFFNIKFEGVEPAAYFFTTVRPVKLEDVQHSHLFRSHNFSFGRGWRVNTVQERHFTTIDARVTMYVLPGRASSFMYYLIYQKPNGTIYLASPPFSRSVRVGGGASISTAVTPGGSAPVYYSLGWFGLTFSDTHSTIEVNIAERFMPINVTFIQMDASHSVVSHMEFPPEELPDSLPLESDMAYVIVEIHELKPIGEINIIRKMPDFGGVHIYRVMPGSVVFEQHWTWFEKTQ